MRSLLPLCLAACASHPPVRTAPDFRSIETEPAPAAAGLYADCIADAVARRDYRRAADASTTLLLFSCTGDPARAFFDGLAAWSAKIDSQVERDGRTIRSTARVHENLFGVDYCARDATGYSCVVTLNTGAFLGR